MRCIARPAWRARCSARNTSPPVQHLVRQSIQLSRGAYTSASAALKFDGLKSRPAYRPLSNVRRNDSVAPPPESFFGTVTANAPHQTAIDQLLEPLTPLANSQAPLFDAERRPLLVLLLTPSFARHALDEQFPLEVWKRIYGGEELPPELEAVTAVVDKLPVREQSAATTQEVKTGVEGLAYSLSSITTAQMEAIESESTREQERQSRPQPHRQWQQEKPRALNLVLTRPGPIVNFNPALTPMYTLQLPLAQTIFSTGRVSTLVRTRYVPSSSQLRAKYQDDKMASFTLQLPLSSGNMKFSAPLIPLTPARKVEACIGNVIRQISSYTVRSLESKTTLADEQPQPASTELEKSISTYFRSSGIQPQPVSVWALILPGSTAMVNDHENPSEENRLLAMNNQLIKRAWSNLGNPRGRKFMNAAIRKILPRGGRLCKVLSGGGGWGKKAGLLSLDPDVSYDVRDRMDDFSHGYAEDHMSLYELSEVNSQAAHPAPPAVEEDSKQDLDALNAVAKKGDTIMFFLASDVHDSQPALKNPISESSDDYSLDLHALMVSFGTIPSSIDSIPLSPSSDRVVEGEVQIIHHANHFGMLSEGGMALTISHVGSSQSTNSESEMKSKTLRTKLDFPFARWSVTQSPNTRTGATGRSSSIPSLDEENEPKSRHLEALQASKASRLRAQADYLRRRKEGELRDGGGFLRFRVAPERDSQYVTQGNFNAHIDATIDAEQDFASAEAEVATETAHPNNISANEETSDSLVGLAARDGMGRRRQRRAPREKRLDGKPKYKSRSSLIRKFEKDYPVDIKMHMISDIPTSWSEQKQQEAKRNMMQNKWLRSVAATSEKSGVWEAMTEAPTQSGAQDARPTALGREEREALLENVQAFMSSSRR